MSALLTPLCFRCGARAKNRIVLAPLTNTQSQDDGSLGPAEQRWLVRRAAGGFGVIETCAAFVAADGKGFDGQLGFASDAQLPALAQLTQALGAHAALSLAQLYHGGVRAPSRLTGQTPWSASSFVEDSAGFEVPRAASAQDIEQVCEAFVSAAVRAQRAGFSGVELHAAHGYLLSQFLSRSMNTRADEWGGNLEGRARLLLRLTRQIRTACPAPFIVGARLSPEDFGHARGLDADETATVARWLDEAGADFVHLSLWDAQKNLKKHPQQHPLTLFRQHVSHDLVLIAAGNVWTSEQAHAVLQLGADAVALGKAAILNPDWPKLHAQPGFQPERGPLSPAQLEAIAVGPNFTQYLRRFKGMVSG